MLKIIFELDKKNIDNEIVSDLGSHLVNSIEGRLIIKSNGQIFFDKLYVCLLELSSQLYKWLYENIKKDFVYNSMEHDEPILIFKKLSKKYWEIDSIWKKDKKVVSSNRELYKSIKRYIKSLDKELKIKYGVETVDIINAKKYIQGY
jgi:hypothetical protein